MKKAALVSVLALSACAEVDTGMVGISKRFGDVKEVLPPGLHFYNPMTTDIVEFEVRENRYQATTECFTKDTQKTNITLSVLYSIEQSKALEIYRAAGENWNAKLIGPTVEGRLKDVVGQYIADELIGKREHVKAAVEDNLKQRMADRGINVLSVEFTNIKFESEYEKAVEAKVNAVQKAAEAKNKTVEVEETARQSVISAKAEAESMRIRAEALAQNKGLAEYTSIEKWNGQLPDTLIIGGGAGGLGPILNLATGASK